MTITVMQRFQFFLEECELIDHVRFGSHKPGCFISRLSRHDDFLIAVHNLGEIGR